jgi:hypothetical protein
VKLDARSTLPAVAVAVGAALTRHGMRAVLTGGACASLYTRGEFQSRDVDFILTGPATQAALDGALASLGFVRAGDRYVHPRVPFHVEFPRGPLAIGGDYQIRPITRAGGGGRVLTLSATDSCRDRLAAFYHWNDRQSLRVAARIALVQRIDLRRVGRWSAAEGFAERFDEFLGEVRRGRAELRRRVGTPRGRRRRRRRRPRPG